MTLKHYYSGDYLDSIVRLEDETQGYSSSAMIGDADIVRVIVDDPDGSLNFSGWKSWRMRETACIDDVVWSGYVGRQRIMRWEDNQTGAARRWELELIEDNGRLGRTVLRTAASDRPTETVSARITWLLSEHAMTVHDIADHGLVEASSVSMDAVDYTGRFPKDVLADCALASGFNYFIRWRDASSDRELCFYDPNTETNDVASAFELSNDEGDIDYATVWPPTIEAVLERDPSRIASGILVQYDGGFYFGDQSAEIVPLFGRVDQVAPTSSVKSASAAAALATRLLNQHDEQDEHITGVQVHVPKQNLNDVKPGQLIYATFTHLPGMTTRRPCRVTRKSFARPANLSQDWYVITLDLTPGPFDALVQVVSKSTGAAGDHAIFSNPPTAGNLLVFAYALRDGGTSAMNSAFSGTRVDNLLGRPINPTIFGAPTYGQVGGGTPDTVAIAWATAVGDEQDIWLGFANGWVTIYELTGVTATGAEVLSQSFHAASATKSLGDFASPGAIQICRLVIDTGDGPTVAETPGSGWTTDTKGRSTYWGGVWHPLTPCTHCITGTTVTSSGASLKWGGVAVALPSA